MSDRPIQAGDLVMVVAPRTCCKTGNLGGVFKVGDIYTGRQGGCSFCGVISTEPLVRRAGEFDGYQIRRIKRIDPPATGDSLPTRREMEETA